MKSVAELRAEFTTRGLSEADAGSDPIALFQQWFGIVLAAGLPEPNALTLATATLDGRPSARVVLLKSADERGFTFFTNYDSRKGQELAANPRAALVFLWQPLERQVRIEGTVEKVAPADSDEYFAVRPLGSRLGAWASAQSAVIPSREFLERQHAEFAKRYAPDAVPRPPYWGGYRVIPEAIEFWQGRPDRLHDRILFHRTTPGWDRRRLSP